jgi:hypothetical protein
MKFTVLVCVLALGSAPSTCSDLASANESARRYVQRLGVDPSQSDVTVDPGPLPLAEWLAANPKVLPKDHLGRVKREVGARSIWVVRFSPRASPSAVVVGGTLWVFVDAVTYKPLTAYGEK